MHRNQLRRWLARNGVDPKAFGSGGEPEDDAPGDGRTTKG
jgi:hypothetical protein